jgi:hypothetical protein
MRTLAAHFETYLQASKAWHDYYIHPRKSERTEDAMKVREDPTLVAAYR